MSDSVAYLATGASDTARVYKSTDKGNHWKAINTPMRSGESYGIYSLNFWSANQGIIAGGSYKDTTYNEKIAFITTDGGNTWTNISKGLPGYISCVASSQNGELIVATGRSGSYYTLDQGKSWQLFGKEAFYTVKIYGNLMAFSGKNGILKVYEFKVK